MSRWLENTYRVDQGPGYTSSRSYYARRRFGFWWDRGRPHRTMKQLTDKWEAEVAAEQKLLATCTCPRPFWPQYISSTCPAHKHLPGAKP